MRPRTKPKKQIIPKQTTIKNIQKRYKCKHCKERAVAIFLTIPYCKRCYTKVKSVKHGI